MGDGDHRRHLRRLRARVPPRHRRRAWRMVGAPAGLIAARGAPSRLPRVLPRVACGAVAATAASYVVTGNCRDGQPHGAYELRMPDGTLRVAGAFNRGKRTGSFIFWSSAGARIAPPALTTTMRSAARWRCGIRRRARRPNPSRKLEAAYAGGRPAGDTRSWHPERPLRGPNSVTMNGASGRAPGRGTRKGGTLSGRRGARAWRRATARRTSSSTIRSRRSSATIRRRATANGRTP